MCGLDVQHDFGTGGQSSRWSDKIFLILPVLVLLARHVGYDYPSMPTLLEDAIGCSGNEIRAASRHNWPVNKALTVRLIKT